MKQFYPEFINIRRLRTVGIRLHCVVYQIGYTRYKTPLSRKVTFRARVKMCAFRDQLGFMYRLLF